MSFRARGTGERVTVSELPLGAADGGRDACRCGGGAGVAGVALYEQFQYADPDDSESDQEGQESR
jgi:hypothetical protein